ncbi:hypothetical protein FQZ97_1052150 [compost metagenome]
MLGRLEIGQVHATANEAKEVAIGVVPGNALVEHPAVAAVVAAQAEFRGKRLARFESTVVGVLATRLVVGVQAAGPVVIQFLFQAVTRELQPALVDPVATHVLVAGPEERR